MYIVFVVQCGVAHMWPWQQWGVCAEVLIGWRIIGLTYYTIELLLELPTRIVTANEKLERRICEWASEGWVSWVAWEFGWWGRGWCSRGLVWCGVVGIGYHCLLTLVWWVALACRRGNRPFLSPAIIDLQSRMKYPGMHLQRFHSICLQLIINFQCTTCLRYLHEGHFSFSLDGHYQSCVIRIRCMRIHHHCSKFNSANGWWERQVHVKLWCLLKMAGFLLANLGSV